MSLGHLPELLGRSDPLGDNLALASHPRMGPAALILYPKSVYIALVVYSGLTARFTGLFFHTSIESPTMLSSKLKI